VKQVAANVKNAVFTAVALANLNVHILGMVICLLALDPGRSSFWGSGGFKGSRSLPCLRLGRNQTSEVA